MARGFFGTRADLFMDLAIVFLTLLPCLMVLAFRFARAKRYRAHRNTQVLTLALVLSILLLFELDIRLKGGSAALLARIPERAQFVHALLRAHIAVATLTFIAWLGLACVSWPRLGRVLPGSFSARHRRLGLVTFIGACALSSSGAAIYVLLYVF